MRGSLISQVKLLIQIVLVAVVGISCIPASLIGDKGGSSFRFPCRRYLDIRKMEERGFGFYAYVLFPEKPNTKADSASYRQIYKLWTKFLEYRELPDRLQGAPDELSIVYWPITDLKREETARTYDKKNQNWETALQWYDYAQAMILSLLLKTDKKQGPYFVASPRPLLFTALEDTSSILSDSVWVCSLDQRTPTEVDSLFSIFGRVLAGQQPVEKIGTWDLILNFIRNELMFMNGQFKRLDGMNLL